MKLKALTEKRAELVKKMNDLVSTADTENRALSEEETAAFDAAEKEVKDLDATIAREERARALNIPAPSAEPAQNNAEIEERAFVNYVLGRTQEQRAGEIQLTQGNNGAIVPVSIANRIIKSVRDKVPFLQLADVVNTNGKLSVPVYTETSTTKINADYVDEGTELTDNVGKFTTVDLTGYVIGALALISNKLKDNTDLDVVGFIVNQVSDAIATKLEGEFINGTAGKITGILSAGNTITAASATAITYDELVSLKHSLKQQFRANARFIMAPDTYTAICKLKDNNGIPYFKEDEYKIIGLPVIESDNMPAMAAGKKAIVCADLSGYTIKMTKAVEIQILREKFATKNMLGVLAFGEYDGKITDGKKIAVLTMKAS